MRLFKAGSFATGLIKQKALEFLVLSIMLGSYEYIGQFFKATRADLLIPDYMNIPLLYCLAAAPLTAALFFLITLYPVVTSGIVYLFYIVFNGRWRNFLPHVSASASFFYVLLWVYIMDFPLSVSFSVQMELMTLFVFWSSFALYFPENASAAQE